MTDTRKILFGIISIIILASNAWCLPPPLREGKGQGIQRVVGFEREKISQLKAIDAQIYIVERVIDGDTIKLTNGERIRLIGIDAPKNAIPKGVDPTLYSPGPEVHQQLQRWGVDIVTMSKMGQEATEFINILLNAKNPRFHFKVYLVPDVQGRDKYGRLLAYVYKNMGISSSEKINKLENFSYEVIDGYWHVFINATMVSSGYATPMTIPPNVTAKQSPEDAGKQHPEGKYADLFKELYEEAMEQKRGLWKKKKSDDVRILSDEELMETISTAPEQKKKNDGIVDILHKPLPSKIEIIGIDSIHEF